MPVYKIDGTTVSSTDGTYVLQPPNNNFLRFGLERARQRLVIPTLPDSSSLSVAFLFDSSQVMFTMFSSNGTYNILFEDKLTQVPAETIIINSFISPIGTFLITVSNSNSIIYTYKGYSETLFIETYFDSPSSSLTLQFDRLDETLTEYSSMSLPASLSYQINLASANALDFLLNTPTGMLNIILSENNVEYNLAIEFGADYIRCYGENSYCQLSYLTRHYRIQIINLGTSQCVALFAAGTLAILEQLPYTFATPTVRFIISDTSNNSIYIYKRSLLTDTGTDLTQLNSIGLKQFNAGTIFSGLTTAFTLASNYASSFYLTFHSDVESIQVQISNTGGYLTINSQNTTLVANVHTRVPFRIINGKLVYFNGTQDIELGNANIIYKITSSAQVLLLPPLSYVNHNVIDKNSVVKLPSTEYALFLLPQETMGQVSLTNPNTTASLTLNCSNIASVSFNSQSYNHLSNFAQMFVNLARPASRSVYFVSIENNIYYVSGNLLYSSSDSFAVQLFFNSNFVVFEGKKVLTSVVAQNVVNQLTVANRYQSLQSKQISVGQRTANASAKNLVVSTLRTLRSATQKTVGLSKVGNISAKIECGSKIQRTNTSQLVVGSSLTSRASQQLNVSLQNTRINIPEELKVASAVENRISLNFKTSRILQVFKIPTIAVGQAVTKAFSQVTQVGKSYTFSHPSVQQVSNKSYTNTAINNVVSNFARNTLSITTKVGNRKSAASASEAVVANKLLRSTSALLTVATRKVTSLFSEMKNSNFVVRLQSSVKQVANVVRRVKSILIGILNKVREDIASQFKQIEGKGKAPIIELEKMVSNVFAVGQLVVSYLENLSYVFNKTIKVFIAGDTKTIQSQQLALKDHKHQQYVKLTEPANSSYKLENTSNIATKHHKHNYIERSSLFDINGTATYVVEKAYLLSGRVKDMISLKNHTHPYERKRIIQLGNSNFKVATEASFVLKETTSGRYLTPPEQIYASSMHSHGDEYVKRNKVVTKAKVIKNGSITFGIGNVAIPLALRNHNHPDYDVSDVKSKIAHLSTTEKINKLSATLLRYTLPNNSVAYERNFADTLLVRLQYLLNKTIPPESIHSNTPLTSKSHFYVYFYLWSAPAFKYFNENHTAECLVKFMNYSVIAQALKQMGINLSFGQETVVKMKFYRRHYGYFIQRHIINYNFPGYPVYSFAAPFAYVPPSDGTDTLQIYISQIVERMNTYYPQTVQRLRLILGLTPIENLPKEPSQVMSFGITSMSPKGLELANGGVPYNVLVLTKRS